MTAVLDPTDGTLRWQGAAHSLLIVAVGSTRDDVPAEFVEATLDADLRWARWFRLDAVALVHGAGDGVDTIADRWARRNAVEVQPFPPDPADRHAGPAIRNRRMIGAALLAARHGWAVRVEAFPGPRSRGTWDLVNVARTHSLGVEIRRPTAER